MLIGLLIQLFFICRNGKIRKTVQLKEFKHDKKNLIIVRDHMNLILPERNLKLEQFKLKFQLCKDPNIMELITINDCIDE